MEQWKTIDGWPLYDVSDDGRVRTWNNRGRRRFYSKIMAPRWDPKGYARVTLCHDGTQRERFIHQLVLEAFVGSRPTPQHEGRHLDGVRSNNAASNLEWSTHAANMRDQYVHGTRARGTTHGMVKLSEEDVLFIRGSTGELLPLAIKFGISKTTVCNIRLGKSWKHLKTPSRSEVDESQRSETRVGER